MFYLQKGRIKLSVLSRTGKEAVVAILEPGDNVRVVIGRAPPDLGLK